MGMWNEGRILQIVRWIARGTAALSAAFIAFMFVGSAISEGMEPFLYLTTREALMMLAFFTLWLGLLLGWRWELVGGAMTVGSMIIFYLLDFAFSGTFLRAAIFLLLALPGALFLACGVVCARRTRMGTIV